jgi:hypothetical protein
MTEDNDNDVVTSRHEPKPRLALDAVWPNMKDHGFTLEFPA